MSNKKLCSSCNGQISSVETICHYCAGILPKETLIHAKSDALLERDAKEIEIKNQLANQFKNHLEFLGFYIIERKQISTHVTFIAKHEKRSTLFVDVMNVDLVLMRSAYDISKIDAKENLFQIYENLNRANNKALISRWSYSQDDDDFYIVVEVFLRKYEKVEF